MSENHSTLSLFWNHIIDVKEQENISLEKACHLVHNLGYDSVDIFEEDLTPENVQTLHEAKMSIALVFAFIPVGNTVRSQCDRLACQVEHYNIPCAMVIPQENLQPMTELLWSNLFDDLRILQTRLSKSSHTLVIEPFDFPGYSFNCLKGLHRYMKEIPGLKICFDTGNFIYSGVDCLQAYSIFKGNIAHVHLKDRLYDEEYSPYVCTTVKGTKLSSAPVGQGIIPIRQLIQRLIQDGYSGPMTVEQHGCRKQLDALRISADHIHLVLCSTPNK